MEVIANLLLQSMMDERHIEEFLEQVHRPQYTPPVSATSQLQVGFHVKKNSVKFIPQQGNRKLLGLSFETDCTQDCFVIIHFAAMDVLDQTGNSMYIYSDPDRFPKAQ